MFTDTQGREWEIEVTVSTMKRVRKLANVNLMDVVGGEVLQDMSRDPVLLVDVIYACIKPTADDRDISDEDFADSLDGDTIDNASRELVDAIINFFPKRKAEVLRKTADKMERLTEQVLTKAEESLENLTLEDLDGNGSINSPDSVVSNQEILPSEN